MVDHATPNLPSRDLDATAAFYAALGFATSYHDPGWLILERGTLVLEFFRDPGTDPASTASSCCLRVDDVDALYDVCVAAGLPVTHVGWPRLHPPRVEDSGMRIGYLVDADGNLLRLVQNPWPAEGPATASSPTRIVPDPSSRNTVPPRGER